MADTDSVRAERASHVPEHRKRLVLVGAGNAHLHVLDEWSRHPTPGVELVGISPTAGQWKAGMMSG